jgi:predicted membrane protein
VQFFADILISATLFAVCSFTCYGIFLLIANVLSGLWNIIFTFLTNHPVLAIIITYICLSILCGMLTSKEEATKKAEQQTLNQKVPQVLPAVSIELQCPICKKNKRDTVFSVGTLLV